MKVSLADQHEPFYREFDSPLMRQIRLEAYGEDIGQHSWVSADELRRDAQRLGLSASSRLLELAVDVVLHLRDRQSLFREVSKLLRPEGRFLFTDAGVITGAVSNDELQRRSFHGYTQFVPIGWNERLLETVGLRLLESEDRTASVFRNASGKLAANRNHGEELERVAGVASFQSQDEYLTTVAELARRGAVSRIVYLTEVRSPNAG